MKITYKKALEMISSERVEQFYYTAYFDGQRSYQELVDKLQSENAQLKQMLQDVGKPIGAYPEGEVLRLRKENTRLRALFAEQNRNELTERE